ncbi:MAG: helix-turn-helix transcriptional regulator [Rhodoglobus sp.]
MSIRHSLLAILDQGDCYGYQLRVEFERRTAQARPLNVGQVYATLDRLERDGLVVKLGASTTGHVFYSITDEGRAVAATWFETAEAGADVDEMALKLALAQSLPGVDAAALVDRQRAATALEVDALRADSSSTDLARQLVDDARIAAAEAVLGWLDRAETLVAESRPFALDVEPPRRGRPVRA